MDSNKSKKPALIALGIVIVIVLVIAFIWYISVKSINWENVYNGLTISGIGLAGVFTVLIIFYLSTKIMMLLANKFSKNEE